ncbi:MAG: CPBP family intramembrane metalloprotease [Saprospiraceae bacterium]|nr:CPBP family intramembrane metalloprotease [Saprospiraceae bacterium]MDW8485251.1 CPBP family intramembrane glutamic endopeptidase [Saprospiraceae bacterium]
MEQEPEQGHLFERQHTPVIAAEYSAFLILTMQLLASLTLGSMAALLYQALATMVGWDGGLIYGGLHANATMLERWQMRTFLILSHVLTFALAGWVVVRTFYPPTSRALDYLQVRREPPTVAIWGGIWLMLFSIPLALYLYQLNRALPLPDVLRQAEEQANEVLKALLKMEDAWELVANLILIALIPAIGEELVFRGVVQQQIMRLVRSPWAAIVLSGAVFSLAHFQFEGFLPRLLLGVILGWLYWRFQSLWVPVAAHFANNAVQVVAQYLYHERVSSLNLEEDVSVPTYLAALSGALILILAMWLNNRKNIL